MPQRNAASELQSSREEKQNRVISASELQSSREEEQNRVVSASELQSSREEEQSQIISATNSRFEGEQILFPARSPGEPCINEIRAMA